jgi:hypothetical protein
LVASLRRPLLLQQWALLTKELQLLLLSSFHDTQDEEEGHLLNLSSIMILDKPPTRL